MPPSTPCYCALDERFVDSVADISQGNVERDALRNAVEYINKRPGKETQGYVVAVIMLLRMIGHVDTKREFFYAHPTSIDPAIARFRKMAEVMGVRAWLIKCSNCVIEVRDPCMPSIPKSVLKFASVE